MDLMSRLFGPPMPSISATELQEKLKGPTSPFVLDVREPEEFRDGHISGAKLIPLGTLQNSMESLPKQREVVCVCASGSRSSSATRILTAAGFQAINMQGGMSAWMRAKLPIKKGSSS